MECTGREIDYAMISRKIREVRLAKNLTQEYLANAAGVNPSHISNIENNRVKISLSTLVNICNAMHVSVDYILAEQYVDPASSLENTILLESRKCSDATKVRLINIIKALQD